MPQPSLHPQPIDVPVHLSWAKFRDFHWKLATAQSTLLHPLLSVKTFQPCRRLWRSATQQSRVMAPLRTLGSRLAWKLKTTQLHATKCKIEKYKKHGGTLDKASSEIYIANMFAMNLSFADMSDDISWNLWMFFYVLWGFVVFICTDGVLLWVFEKVLFWWKIVSSLIGIDVWFQSSLLQTNRLVPAFSAQNAARSSTPIRLGMLQDAADHNSRRATKIENFALIMLRGSNDLCFPCCVCFLFSWMFGQRFQNR